MRYHLHLLPHTLLFKFDARTSRGAIAEHKVYYLVLSEQNRPEKQGIGECAPLAGLSVDATPDLEAKLEQLCRQVNSGAVALTGNEEFLDTEGLALAGWPAIRFALETAWLDLQHGGNRIIFRNAFSEGQQGIAINGLIWMGDKAFMQDQIKKKLKEGYTCLKLKIGSLDFATELEILESIRSTASAAELTIRVDANGAFKPEEAFRKLERLARYELHSIEQPIRQQQPEQMAQLCAYTPVPIALDEELIGVEQPEEKARLLDVIKPQYIILKPTLVGGLQASANWISLAEGRGIGWWVTSALESNIGLNSVSQFTATYTTTMPQGLGTGQLYHNNLASPLTIKQGFLWYDQQQEWGNVPSA
ncbi:o-succinylbenzoate synthase [Pontibacter qinzhouensis]|uniref:O-succinylbenzoate synthase n=1 Tax=Pontibacter qinzhouensis TaxID=2603253 RepID=A0A5C8KD88_9BACT|nr:o-succinylbenzoate synthase [Pontibacter qinzhouensis]TXK49842.1 o-succinylbenzoate synthase [Pontibacter qinzhouensis]